MLQFKLSYFVRTFCRVSFHFCIRNDIQKTFGKHRITAVSAHIFTVFAFGGHWIAPLNFEIVVHKIRAENKKMRNKRGSHHLHDHYKCWAVCLHRFSSCLIAEADLCTIELSGTENECLTLPCASSRSISIAHSPHLPPPRPLNFFFGIFLHDKSVLSPLPSRWLHCHRNTERSVPAQTSPKRHLLFGVPFVVGGGKKRRYFVKRSAWKKEDDTKQPLRTLFTVVSCPGHA